MEYFWGIPNRYAGRPGPNRLPWMLEDIVESGFGSVLSLTERMIGASSDFYEHGLLHVCIPLPKAAPPHPADIAAMVFLLPHTYEIAAQLRSETQKPVLVHCSSGKDRTGLFMVYARMRELGEATEVAMKRVAEVQPALLSAKGWSVAAEDVLRAVRGQSPS